MKHLLTLVVIAFAAQASAQGLSSRVQSELEDMNKTAQIEAQYFSTSISPIATFGPAVSFEIDAINRWGLFGRAPVTRTEDVNVASLGGFWRHLFSEKKTHLFTDLGLTGNFGGTGGAYSDAQGVSLDGSMGLAHRFNEDFSLGGMAGFVLTNLDVKRTAVVRDSAYSYIYPQFGLYGAMAF